MLTSDTDASLKWCSTPPLWHIDAVGGASTPSLIEVGEQQLSVVAPIAIKMVRRGERRDVPLGDIAPLIRNK
jgi:hypothetical protein